MSAPSSRAGTPIMLKRKHSEASGLNFVDRVGTEASNCDVDMLTTPQHSAGKKKSTWNIFHSAKCDISNLFVIKLFRMQVSNNEQHTKYNELNIFGTLTVIIYLLVLNSRNQSWQVYMFEICLFEVVHIWHCITEPCIFIY